MRSIRQDITRKTLSLYPRVYIGCGLQVTAITLQRPGGMRSFGKHGVLMVESGGVDRLVRIDHRQGGGQNHPLHEGFPGGPVSVTVVGETAYVLEGQLARRVKDAPAPTPFQALAVPVGKP